MAVSISQKYGELDQRRRDEQPWVCVLSFFLLKVNLEYNFLNILNYDFFFAAHREPGAEEQKKIGEYIFRTEVDTY